jgi:ubiquinone/menaquinone biosynthesis C-methylase UbiE
MIVENDPIRSTTCVTRDLTHDNAYEKLVAEEIEHYSRVDVTDHLTEGGCHAHKSWEYYFDYLRAHVFGTSFYDEIVASASQFKHPRILSLGCGYGGHDLAIARRLRNPYELTAVDLNPHVYKEALRRSEAENLSIRFKAVDLNFIEIRPNSYDVIYAMASLHHVLNLEHCFAQLYEGLGDNGRLIVLDVIGKTQVLFWKENVEFAAQLVRTMPIRYRPSVGKRFWKHLRFNPYTVLSRYEEPSVQVGMEGIRQEEIEAEMLKWFKPLKLYKYNAFMRLICTNAYLGARLNPEKTEDRVFMDKLIEREIREIECGRLKPTELFGIFEKKPVPV